MKLDFYKTEKEERGIDILNKIGELHQNDLKEYIAFTHNGVEYPVHAISINREKDGYNIYCDDKVYKLLRG